MGSATVKVMGLVPATVLDAQLDAEMVHVLGSALVPELAIDAMGVAKAHEIDWRPSVKATVQPQVY